MGERGKGEKGRREKQLKIETRNRTVNRTHQSSDPEAGLGAEKCGEVNLEKGKLNFIQKPETTDDVSGFAQLHED